MKYQVIYEVRSEGKSQSLQFAFEAEQEPSLTDENLLDAARMDSVKVFRAGLAGLSITSVSLVS